MGGNDAGTSPEGASGNSIRATEAEDQRGEGAADVKAKAPRIAGAFRHGEAWSACGNA